jgi:hypothetical protein
MDWRTMIVEILPYMAAILTLVLTWLAMKAVRYFGWKWQEAQVQEWISQVVVWVEEWAASKVLGPGEEPPTGQQKLDAALGAIRKRYPKIDYADVRIHSALMNHGLGTAGSPPRWDYIDGVSTDPKPQFKYSLSDDDGGGNVG